MQLGHQTNNLKSFISKRPRLRKANARALGINPRALGTNPRARRKKMEVKNAV